MTTTEKLMAALNLWLELSEVDPGKKSFTFGGGGVSEWTVLKMHDLIKEGLELDDSNMTGLILLEDLSSSYFNSRNFSVNQLLDDPVRSQQYVRKAAELRQLVQAPEFQEQISQFIQLLCAALRTYGMDTDKAMDLASDRSEIGYLRRDAFRSIKNLRVDQFLSGQPEPEGFTPVFNSWVHQFWNINTLVEAACHQPSGITLSLVRDPDDLQSYFVFAVRNGGNLYLLSDVPVHAHPLQKYMSRRPDRAFDSRSSQNWFPYDLLGLTYDEELKTFFADEARRRSLVPQQQSVDRLKPIAQLAPKEIVWLTMMFELIKTKFWDKKYQAPALSYTAAMIRPERPLLAVAEGANLPVVAYTSLNLPALTRDDMTLDNVSKFVGNDGGNPNAWLEARYSDQVEPELFNLLDSGANKLYLPPSQASLAATQQKHTNHHLAIVTPSYVSVLPQDDKKVMPWEKEGRYSLHALNTTTFGTQAELEANRVYLARHNQAKAIQRLADEEYARRKDEIVEWWTTRINDNMDYLCSLAAAGDVYRIFEPTGPGCELSTADGWTFPDKAFHFVRTWDDGAHPVSRTTLSLYDGFSRGKFHCALTGGPCSYYVLFQPQNPKQLAELAGCEVSELPDVLQNWSPGRDFKGNPNLSRIDPMAWKLKDPWTQVNFRIALYLSKRGLAQCKKKYPESAAAGEAEHKARTEKKTSNQAPVPGSNSNE